MSANKRVRCYKCKRQPILENTVEAIVMKGNIEKIRRQCFGCANLPKPNRNYNRRDAYSERVQNETLSRVVENGSENDLNMAVALSDMLLHARHYFSVENYFSQEDCKVMKDYCINKPDHRFESIEFSWAQKRDENSIWVYQDTEKRRQQKTILEFTDEQDSLFPLPVCLVKFIQSIISIHPTTKSVVVKLLRSEDGCARQLMHVDDNDFIRGENKPQDMSLNMIVPLENDEENPTNIYLKKAYSSEEKAKQLLQGSVFCFSSDCEHAGYEHNNGLENYILHFSIGTSMYPNSGVNVGLRDNWNKYKDHVTRKVKKIS